MDKSSPIEAKPLRSFKPDFVDDDHSQTENISSPTPLVVSPLRTIRPVTTSDDVNDEIHKTTTPPPLMVTPLQTIRPVDDSNNDDSYSADAGPSTVPIKRGPSEDVNEETHTTTPPPPLMVTPLRTIRPFDDSNNDDSYNADAGPSTVPIKRGPSEDVNDENHTTTTPPPLMVTPLRTIRPFDDSNDDSYDAGAGPSTVPMKRGRGRPKGSKNSTNTAKKPKIYDPNSKVVTSCPNFDSGITEAERETGNQELVDSVLMRFDAIRRRLCQLNYMKGILTTASTTCRNLGIGTNLRKRIGPVPGVQVGDIFYFWGEMGLIGLHSQMVAGIDYMTAKDGAVDGPIATSVVTSGHYDDETEEIESLIYTGHGGTDKNGQARDQKLERGNLALEASKTKGNEVRVIRGEEDPYDQKKKVYIYDGLYSVSDYWKVKGRTGFKEFKFKLVRKPGQPSGYAIWKSAENLRKHGLSNSRKGLILQDLSSGKETLPVPLVNEVDEDDKKTPEDFVYTRSLCYSSITPNLHVDGQSLGCRNCRGGSCQAARCMCIQRNGGELPYHNSVLVCRKPMIYECGESCPCINDCKNRVVQTGLKIRLEVFKTANCGWGLRSWEPIRAGTFICEFAGMNKTKEEVEEEDDYVFDSSRIYKRFKWNYEPELLGEDVGEPVPEVFNLPSQVLISARKHGNVGRFMNHSCSPNVLWQPIEYELNGESHVRIGFFAMQHIPPLTELRYDYGVSCVEKIGEDETIFKGKKICLCGSVNCRGSFG